MHVVSLLVDDMIFVCDPSDTGSWPLSRLGVAKQRLCSPDVLRDGLLDIAEGSGSSSPIPAAKVVLCCFLVLVHFGRLGEGQTLGKHYLLLLLENTGGMIVQRDFEENVRTCFVGTQMEMQPVLLSWGDLSVACRKRCTRRASFTMKQKKETR